MKTRTALSIAACCLAGALAWAGCVYFGGWSDIWLLPAIVLLLIGWVILSLAPDPEIDYVSDAARRRWEDE